MGLVVSQDIVGYNVLIYWHNLMAVTDSYCLHLMVKTGGYSHAHATLCNVFKTSIRTLEFFLFGQHLLYTQTRAAL